MRIGAVGAFELIPALRVAHVPMHIPIVYRRAAGIRNRCRPDVLSAAGRLGGSTASSPPSGDGAGQLRRVGIHDALMLPGSGGHGTAR